MEHDRIPPRPEAPTDERASLLNPQAEANAGPGASGGDGWPEFASQEEARVLWAGVGRGLHAAGGGAAHPHIPPGFATDLDRDGAEPGLVSTKLFDPAPRAARHDGFTSAAEQHFLQVLAETGVVADACRAAGVSRPTAYNRRNSAAGRAFALAWDAALLLSRRAIADDVMSRARHGVIDRVYRDGVLVAERHRYDNRLTMAVLTRLDRIAEGLGANAPVVNAVANEFEQFVDRLPIGLEEAEDFIAARISDPAAKEEPADPLAQGGEEALLARLANYEAFGGGLADEIDTKGLVPAEMENWTEAEFDRAHAARFLGALAPEEWPAAARDFAADGTDGMCKVRKLYLAFHPPRPLQPVKEVEDDFSGCGAWEDPDRGWVTDFPPPPGFDGYEEGDSDGDNYCRELAPEELAVIEADVAAQESQARADREAARRRYFEIETPGDPCGGGGVEA
jgi:hypothetical protein